MPAEPRLRAGFFLGDGAGVGKGRTIAACIKEHFAAGHGTRALWVSVSKDLNFDAQRDLDDVRSDTRVFPEVRPRHCQHPTLDIKSHIWPERRSVWVFVSEI